MGNIQSYDSVTGVAWYQHTLTKIKLRQTLGRAIVVHELFDHGNGFNCSATGNSGNRFSICVIGVAADNTTIPSVPSTVALNNDFVTVDCADSAHSLIVSMVMLLVAAALFV